jgi:V8-like Glu-specific endopeptidase
MNSYSSSRPVPSSSSVASLLRRGALALKLGVAGALLAGCGATAPEDNGPVEVDQAVAHGAADRGRHPAVLALVAADADGTALCSSTLVAPDVVLTARHCVVKLASEALDCPSHDVKTGKTREPSTLTIYAGDDVKGGKVVAHGKRIVTPSESGLCDHDIALVQLDTPVAGIAPLDIGLDDELAAGTKITAVGFGLNADGADASAGTRRYRSGVAIVSTTANEFVVGEATCSGDSGGPAIDVATGHVVGVVSRGTSPCNEATAQNVYSRVTPWASLIKKLVKNVDPDGDGDGAGDAGRGTHKGGGDGDGSAGGAGDVGDACTNGSSCSSGICVKAKGGGYCTEACGKGVGTCDSGFKCRKTKKNGSVCTRASASTKTSEDDEAT